MVEREGKGANGVERARGKGLVEQRVHVDQLGCMIKPIRGPGCGQSEGERRPLGL